MRTPKHDQFMEMVLGSQNIVALTGAGLSTSAGIPDFRSPKGIYADPTVAGERVFDINVFREDPTVFSSFFAKLYPQMKDAQPSKGHKMLKKLQDMRKLKCVITQNIDGLDVAAGCDPVIEVHGHIRDYVCIDSVHHKVPTTQLDADIRAGRPIKCPECGAWMKPDVVFFGEHVHNLEKALTEVQKADVLLIMGTSLTVYPVAGLPDYCSDETKIVILNGASTPLDAQADLVFHEDIDTFTELVRLA
ncbi:MAG: SIR2 family NAD-dependent protein deacylase [Brevinema sp.]